MKILYLRIFWFLDRSSLTTLSVVLANSSRVLRAVLVWSGIWGCSCICLFWPLFLHSRFGWGELSIASIENERTLFWVRLEFACSPTLADFTLLPTSPREFLEGCRFFVFSSIVPSRLCLLVRVVFCWTVIMVKTRSVVFPVKFVGDLHRTPITLICLIRPFSPGFMQQPAWNQLEDEARQLNHASSVKLMTN